MESATFQYDDSYLALSAAYALDPVLPLASGPFHTPTTHSMFNSFRDPNPEPVYRRMSTPIDEGVFDGSPDVLVEVAPIYFRLDDREALRVLREVSDSVSMWQEVAERNSIPGVEIDIMRPAFFNEARERVQSMIREP